MKAQFSNIDTQIYFSEIFTREDAMALREEIVSFTGLFAKKQRENEEVAGNFKEKLEEIFKDIEKMREIVEKNMKETYENKLQAWGEKIKRQNHDLWQESLKYMKNDFKEIRNFFVKFLKIKRFFSKYFPG